ncbi:MAG: tRNA (adenosine(37)-N6)-threonylcarbamoyltransferase complex dimerization subunit type 1 TsaB [Pyrinomonadaceae bacterium]
MNTETRTILAIEAAVEGGSLSLLQNSREVANWIGTSGISKAEDLLFNIDRLLTENGVSRFDIDLIAVSAGPGSFTGIRIGLATAMGLRAGLNTEICSVSALTSIANAVTKTNDVIVALPTGRNSICTQRFEKIENQAIAQNAPQTIDQENFGEILRAENNVEIIIHGSLADDNDVAERHTNFGWNIANAVGRFCNDHPAQFDEPLFISKSF